jgi:hypothetical protein
VLPFKFCWLKIKGPVFWKASSIWSGLWRSILIAYFHVNRWKATKNNSLQVSPGQAYGTTIDCQNINPTSQRMFKPALGSVGRIVFWHLQPSLRRFENEKRVNEYLPFILQTMNSLFGTWFNAIIIQCGARLYSGIQNWAEGGGRRGHNAQSIKDSSRTR